MDQRVKDDKDGSSVRDHLTVLASRGDVRAQQRLTPLSSPPELEYLRDWLFQLHGRSGVSMSGLNGLTYTTIADWSRLKDVDIEPFEVDALIYLDAVMLNPGDG